MGNDLGCFPLTSVVSRKTHGTVGDFDIALPPAGNPGIECRTGPTAGAHKIVYTLDPGRILTGAGSATTSQTGAGVSTALGPKANQVTVNLTGITNAQHLTVTLNGVQDTTGLIINNLVAHMDVLLGDVNSTRRTDSGDVTAVRNHTVSIPDQTTFRFDVNASGRIDAGDVTVTRNASVTVLP